MLMILVSSSSLSSLMFSIMLLFFSAEHNFRRYSENIANINMSQSVNPYCAE